MKQEAFTVSSFLIFTTTSRTMQNRAPFVEDRLQPYLFRFREGEWRAPIFRDMVLDEMRALGRANSLAILDIGCGRGFDDEIALQTTIAAEARFYVGVEPDSEIPLNPVFSEVHRTFLESAPIPPESVDVAFAVMVLEHLRDPQPFWDRLFEVLKVGGVFFGFTIDARHWFAKASRIAEALRLKDWYLDRLHGRRGETRYANYPVFYRCNTPAQVASCATRFRSIECTSFGKLGQMDYYLPTGLRGIARTIDRLDSALDRPGSLLVVRAVK